MSSSEVGEKRKQLAQIEQQKRDLRKQLRQYEAAQLQERMRAEVANVALIEKLWSIWADRGALRRVEWKLSDNLSRLGNEMCVHAEVNAVEVKFRTKNGLYLYRIRLTNLVKGSGCFIQKIANSTGPIDAPVDTPLKEPLQWSLRAAGFNAQCAPRDLGERDVFVAQFPFSERVNAAIWDSANSDDETRYENFAEFIRGRVMHDMWLMVKVTEPPPPYDPCDDEQVRKSKEAISISRQIGLVNYRYKRIIEDGKGFD